jgi:hypothetical protein
MQNLLRSLGFALLAVSVAYTKQSAWQPPAGHLTATDLAVPLPVTGWPSLLETWLHTIKISPTQP